MKTHITLILALSLALGAQSQSITILDTAGNPVTGTQITVTGDAYAPDLGLPLIVTQSTGTSAVINVRRYELDVLPGTMNYFCWFECYAPQDAGALPLWQAEDPVSIGATQEFEGFHAYYQALGVSGSSCFRYVWYRTSDQMDSAWVDICFSAAPVGITEVTKQAVRLDISPNPSSGEVSFQFDGQSIGRRSLVLHNALGERVSSLAVNTAQRKITLGEGRLPAGVWFASLEVDGRAVATRRFVITER